MWNDFIWFSIPICLFLIISSFTVYLIKNKLITDVFVIISIVLFTIFIFLLWKELERPPMRTMGETRLWYSFFLMLIGYIGYRYWNYKWLLVFSNIMAIVFIIINIMKPEIHSKNLMPALQSIWFVPHVIVYMFSYATLGAATLASIFQIYQFSKNKDLNVNLLYFIDNIIYLGFAFLSLGMIMGAIWAKEAWGHYWSWDPKETWAFVTAAAYLIYIHIRLRKNHTKFALYFLPFAFILLMITWVGVNYLPSAQTSIHTYTR